MIAFIAQSQSGSSFAPILLMLLLGGLLYFVLVRPQQKRAKAQQRLVGQAEVGDEIITQSGIYGTITDIDEEEGTITLEIAPGTEIVMMRAAIGRLLTEPAYEDDPDEDAGPDEIQDDHTAEGDSAQGGTDQPGQIQDL
jgi:preprotein translocase subunit YajC